MATVDPAFTAVTPSAAVLAIAAKNAAPGQTAEQYLASRGGINAAGYFGDSWKSTQNLSDKAYNAIVNGPSTGGPSGATVNAATAKLQYDSAIAAIPTTYTTAQRAIATQQAAASYNSQISASNAANQTDTPLIKDVSGNPIVVTNTGADVSMTGMPTITPAGGSANADPGALQIITDALTAAGLGSLASSAWAMWNKGFDINAIMDDPVNGVRASAVYKQNFPAMAALNAAGRGISEATYIAKQNADLEIMKQYNLTPGVFDTKEYLGKLMINNVNATDLTNRLNAFQDTVGSYDANIKKYAKDTYGISDGDLMTWAMDPTKALPAIQQQAKAMQIGGAAVQAGFGGAGANGELTQAQSEALAAQGITQAQAQQGFTNLGQMGQYGQALPGTDVSGSLTNQQMIDAQFQSNAAAIQALQKVKGTRTAEFQAGGGAAATAAGVVGAGANLAT